MRAGHLILAVSQDVPADPRPRSSTTVGSTTPNPTRLRSSPTTARMVGERSRATESELGGELEYPLWNISFEVAKVKGRRASDASLTYLRRHTQLSLADLRGGATVVHREGACTDYGYPDAQKSRSHP
jgi:hypothetical protein